MDMRRLMAFIGGITAVAVAGTALAVTGSAWEAAPDGRATAPSAEVSLMLGPDDSVSKTTGATPDNKPPKNPERHGDPASKEPKEPKDSYDTTPPELAITHPVEGQVFADKSVLFKGTTEPGARVFAGKWEADVDSLGNWKIVLVLSEGKNHAKLTAKDGAGNQSFATVTVHYAPTTTTKIDKPDTPAFTAAAKFGACSEHPPFDVYYGSGKPGSHVYVKSEFGNGTVEINDKGQWEIEVFFEGAPVGKTFQVKVKDDFGNYKLFEFTYTG